MKKKYYSWFVASMLMLAAASCSKEEAVGSSSSKEMTTFKISLEDQSQSRAAGEGERVSKLYYEVYQNGRKVLDNNGHDANADPVTIVDGAAIVEMPIMRGEKYDLMFWAEAENSIYDATDLKSIKVDYSKADANQEAYDAFFYGEQGFKATSNETTIELRRPFGQLNVGTTVADWETAKQMIVSGDPVTASQLKLTGLANRFNVLTHVASVEGEVGEVTFKKAALINETFRVKTSETEYTEYQNLSMNYLLVPTSGENSHKANVNITAASFWREGEKELFSLNVPNVPVQRNWRTNILGDLLAADKTFEIVIVPIFDDTIDYPLVEIPEISLRSDYAEVYTAKGLLKWAYMVNKQADKKNYGLKLMGDIEMPALTIEEDATNGTYAFTETPITVNEEGVPSGSNWMPICVGYTDKDWDNAYQGHIDGNGYTIKGLRVLQDISYVGFVAVLYDNASLKNLTIEDAAIKGTSNTGIVGGRSQHGGWIENVHVKNSKITGTSEVGGIVGRNYRRDKEGVDEDLSFVKDCSIDKNSSVTGTTYIGGICGENYGAVIMKCTSSATVKGDNYVGGIVGYSREYYHDASAYVIGCGTTSDAVITATNHHVGGIVGQNFTDNDHQSCHYVVACYSHAKSITGGSSSKGLISGSNVYNSVMIGTWAEENGGMALYGGNHAGTISGSQIFASAASVTEADVQAMNEAIAAFNNLNAEVSCPYIWTWTSGDWPVLTSVEND